MWEEGESQELNGLLILAFIWEKYKARREEKVEKVTSTLLNSLKKRKRFSLKFLSYF